MNYYTIVSGTGKGKTEITSFDNALLNSKIANYNLVRISSILPSGAKLKKVVKLPEGSILYTAYAFISASSDSKVISAAVGVAIPENSAEVGVIMEYSDYCPAKVSDENVRKMLIEAMQNRNSRIKEIKTISSEITPDSDDYSTVFAGISIW